MLVPSFYGAPQYEEIFLFRNEHGNLPIQSASFWPIYCSLGVHKDASSCVTSLQITRHQGSCISGWLDNQGGFSSTNFYTRPTDYQTPTIAGLDNILAEVYLLPHKNEFLGLYFNLQTSVISPPTLFQWPSSVFALIWSQISLSLCQTNIINQQQCDLLCSVHPPGSFTSQVPTMLAQPSLASVVGLGKFLSTKNISLISAGSPDHKYYRM